MSKVGVETFERRVITIASCVACLNGVAFSSVLSMLYSIEKNRYVDFIPYEDKFKTWRSQLTNEQYEAIYNDLNSRIAGGEIHTSSWIPGQDWSSTVFDPIYSAACNGNEEASAQFFGIILWVVVRDREDVWSYGRYEKDGILIKGLTYFKLDNPPPR